MKNLLFLLTIFTIMNTACSSSDKEKEIDPPANKDTSFVVVNTNDAEYRDMVVGYFAKDGKCKKVAELGTIKNKATSKEVKVTNSEITEVYLFYSATAAMSYKMNKAHKIEQGKKNEIKIAKDYQDVSVNSKDDTQYPH